MTLRIYSLYTKYRKVNTRQSMVSAKILTRALQILAYVLSNFIFFHLFPNYTVLTFFFFNVVKFLFASVPPPPPFSFLFFLMEIFSPNIYHINSFSWLLLHCYLHRDNYPITQPRLAHCSICSSPCSLSNHSGHAGEWSCEGSNT